MKIIVFSVEDANRAIVEIRPIVERMVEAKTRFDRLEERADVLSIAAAGASATNPDAVELRGVLEARRVIGEQLSEGVDAVHKLGGQIKDIDQGLVDFYALSGDRLVFLCWKLGESEVAHWHSLQGGYTTRQPLKNAELE